MAVSAPPPLGIPVCFCPPEVCTPMLSLVSMELRVLFYSLFSYGRPRLPDVRIREEAEPGGRLRHPPPTMREPKGETL